jgi:hypothetical protein
MQVLMSLHTNNQRYIQLTVNDLTKREPFSPDIDLGEIQ